MDATTRAAVGAHTPERGNLNEPQANTEACGNARYRSHNAGCAAHDRYSGWNALRDHARKAAQVIWRFEEGLISRNEARFQLASLLREVCGSSDSQGGNGSG